MYQQQQLEGLYPQDQAQEVQAYWDTRNKLFPNITAVQSAYFDGGKDPAMLRQFPELKEYWDWNRQYKELHPGVKAYIEEQTAKYGGSASSTSSTYGGGGFSNAWGLYNIARDQQFPQWRVQQDQYYNLREQDPDQAKAYLKQTPSLTDYWDWKRQYLAQHPDAQNYSTGVVRTPDTQNDEIDMKQFDDFYPVLMRQLMGWAYAGQKLSSGARDELSRVWEKQGKPGGTLENYMKMVLSVMEAQ